MSQVGDLLPASSSRRNLFEAGRLDNEATRRAIAGTYDETGELFCIALVK